MSDPTQNKKVFSLELRQAISTINESLADADQKLQVARCDMCENEFALFTRKDSISPLMPICMICLKKR